LDAAVGRRYPHELSGGMKQRVLIAMSLATKPKLIILDEPTSALDVITQANIMNLLKKLRNEMGFTYMFITHDLGLASELADSVAVMYAGKIVEIGPAESVYLQPNHPYTKLLMDSVPTLREDRPPSFIPGAPPDLINLPNGCSFHPRCPYVIRGKCDVDDPPMIKADHGSYAACWLLEKERK
ncbi:MAG: ABC transporter ATP-binding protein, partial [Candidatus Caldarchaeum sp.]